MPRKTAKKKETTFGKDKLEGMKLVLAHQRGEIELEQVWPKPIDVKAIRKLVKMSQAQLSRATASVSAHCRNGSKAAANRILPPGHI